MSMYHHCPPNYPRFISRSKATEVHSDSRVLSSRISWGRLRVLRFGNLADVAKKGGLKANLENHQNQRYLIVFASEVLCQFLELLQLSLVGFTLDPDGNSKEAQVARVIRTYPGCGQNSFVKSMDHGLTVLRCRQCSELYGLFQRKNIMDRPPKHVWAAWKCISHWKDFFIPSVSDSIAFIVFTWAVANIERLAGSTHWCHSPCECRQEIPLSTLICIQWPHWILLCLSWQFVPSTRTVSLKVAYLEGPD